MRVHVNATARRDVREISNAYEDERAGLGDEFVDEIKILLTRIREMPLSFPRVADPTRRALLKRFPYAVYFEIAENQRISVVAVFHLRRDPRTIMRRLER